MPRLSFRARFKTIATVALTLLALLLVIALETALAPRVIIDFSDAENVKNIKSINLSFPMYLGDTFSTSYIHSVQLCEVIDVYCVSDGRLWLLEEQTGSTGAGLPYNAPEHGFFYHDLAHGVYRYIGGKRNFQEILLRVGTDKIGRNTLILPGDRTINLYSQYPDELLRLSLATGHKATAFTFCNK